MTLPTIEKNIPIPPHNEAGRLKGTEARRKYPFPTMEVGDSFVSESKCVRMAACAYARSRPGLKFVSRQQAGGYRIWRVA